MLVIIQIQLAGLWVTILLLGARNWDTLNAGFYTDSVLFPHISQNIATNLNNPVAYSGNRYRLSLDTKRQHHT